MTAITMRLLGTEAEAIEEMVEDHAGLNPHLAGRVALRLGLKVIDGEPGQVDAELRAIRKERRTRRKRKSSAKRDSHGS